MQNYHKLKRIHANIVQNPTFQTFGGICAGAFSPHSFFFFSTREVIRTTLTYWTGLLTHTLTHSLPPPRTPTLAHLHTQLYFMYAAQYFCAWLLVNLYCMSIIRFSQYTHMHFIALCSLCKMFTVLFLIGSGFYVSSSMLGFLSLCTVLWSMRL